MGHLEMVIQTAVPGDVGRSSLHIRQPTFKEVRHDP
jgi:hypothetical protein